MAARRRSRDALTSVGTPVSVTPNRPIPLFSHPVEDCVDFAGVTISVSATDDARWQIARALFGGCERSTEPPVLTFTHREKRPTVPDRHADETYADVEYWFDASGVATRLVGGLCCAASDEMSSLVVGGRHSKRWERSVWRPSSPRRRTPLPRPSRVACAAVEREGQAVVVLGGIRRRQVDVRLRSGARRMGDSRRRFVRIRGRGRRARDGLPEAGQRPVRRARRDSRRCGTARRRRSGPLGIAIACDHCPRAIPGAGTTTCCSRRRQRGSHRNSGVAAAYRPDRVVAAAGDGAIGDAGVLPDRCPTQPSADLPVPPRCRPRAACQIGGTTARRSGR